LAAHLFIMYFACVSTITPPVAFTAYAAAGIAKADPNETGWIATRLGIAAYIIPFAFVYNPAILASGRWYEILWATLMGMLSGYALACGINSNYRPVLRATVTVAALGPLDPRPGRQSGGNRSGWRGCLPPEIPCPKGTTEPGGDHLREGKTESCERETTQMNLDETVKSRESTLNVMPANPGSGPGQAPASRSSGESRTRKSGYKNTRPRLPVTTYESVNLESNSAKEVLKR
jgi:hypothetical protein